MEIIFSLIVLIMIAVVWTASRRRAEPRRQLRGTEESAKGSATRSVEGKVQDKTAEPMEAIISRLETYVESRKGDASRDMSPEAILSRLRDRYVTGTGVPTADGGWTLNPKSTFPLTIYGIDATGVENLKLILDNNSPDSYGSVPSLVRLMARRPFRCKEIDDYINDFKPKYIAKIQEMQKSSSEWAASSDQDREDLLVEFRQQAINSLAVRPDCHLTILFELEPEDLHPNETLIEQFSFDNIRGFLDYADNNNEILMTDTSTKKIAGLLVYTYLIACTYRRANDEVGEKVEMLGTGWGIFCESDACDFCKRHESKKYSKKKVPNVPLHIGCRCEVGEVFE